MHPHPHAFTSFRPLCHEGLALPSRRNLLKAGLAGVAGLSLPGLLRAQAESASNAVRGKSLILLWMTGGPSHIDTWDPKPDRPPENRGPFGVIHTKLPGVIICEHLPKMAAMMDRFTLIRSVDSEHSNHEPNRVMQSGFRDAAPRVNKAGERRPAIGSVVAKHHGPNHPSMPAYATFMKSRSHVAFAGDLGKAYDPFVLNQAAAGLPVVDLVGKPTGRITDAKLFQTTPGVGYERIDERRGLLKEFDQVRTDVDLSGSMAVMDRYGQQAVDMLLGRRMQNALDLAREPEATRNRYGKHLWCQQTLLARRMVEAGAAFITLDLSYHTASGTWDNHGDNIPPYGGIMHGLKPLLPLFDHLITTLVGDLDQRGSARQLPGRCHGGVWPHAQGGHARQQRWSQPLAASDVDGHGRRWLPARASDRRDGTGRRTAERAAGHTGRSGGDHLSSLRRAARHCLYRSHRPADSGRTGGWPGARGTGVNRAWNSTRF